MLPEPQFDALSFRLFLNSTTPLEEQIWRNFRLKTRMQTRASTRQSMSQSASPYNVALHCQGGRGGFECRAFFPLYFSLSP